MTVGRYRHKPNTAKVEGPVLYQRSVPNAVTARKLAEPGMYIVTVESMHDVTRATEVHVLTAAELDHSYEPLDWVDCGLCHSPRAHGTCTHVVVVGDQVQVGRLAWERICDELALNRSKAKAHP